MVLFLAVLLLVHSTTNRLWAVMTSLRPKLQILPRWVLPSAVASFVASVFFSERMQDSGSAATHTRGELLALGGSYLFLRIRETKFSPQTILQLLM